MSCSFIGPPTCHYYPQMSRSICNAKADSCSPEVTYITKRPLTLKTQSCNVRDGIKCHGPSMSMKCVAHDVQWQQWQPIAVQFSCDVLIAHCIHTHQLNQVNNTPFTDLWKWSVTDGYLGVMLQWLLTMCWWQWRLIGVHPQGPQAKTTTD